MISTHALTLSKTSVTSHSVRILPTVVARSGSLSRRPRPYQQVRAFRIGLWSSYLDPNFQKEFRRRQRMVRHKYIDALNRKLSWDRHFPMHRGHLKHSGLKGFMCSAWRGQDSRPGGRWVNSDELDYINRRNTVEKSRGIEDVEQNALNHLLDSHRHTFIRARARMFGPGWSTGYSESWVSRPDQKSTVSPADNLSASSTTYGSEGFKKRFHNREYDQHEEQTEYEIDPITNRKVPKKPAQAPQESRKPIDVPVKTFRGYRSQFDNLEPPNPQPITKSQQAPRPIVTQKYSPPKEKSSSSPIASRSEEIDPLAKYEQKADFNSCRQYDASAANIDYSDPVQQGLKNYDDMLSKKTSAEATARTTSSQESDQDGLKAYDEKVKNQVRQFFASPYEAVEQFDPVQQAIDRYNSFKGTNPSTVVYPDKTETEDKVLQAKREYDQSASRKAFLRDQQANRLLDSIQKYEDIMSEERAKGHVTGKLGHEQLHPLLRAIREYEASVADKKTDPREGAASDQTDPLLQAIREYKCTVSRAEATNPAASEHIEKVAIDPLLNAISEYEAFVVQGEARSSVEAANSDECLKTYDAKVNFYRKPFENEIDESKQFQFKENSTIPIARPMSDVEKSNAAAADQPTIPKSWAHLPQKIRELFAKEAKSDSEIVDESSTVCAVPKPIFDTQNTEADKTLKRKALEQDFEAAQLAEVRRLSDEFLTLRRENHEDAASAAQLGELQNKSEEVANARRKLKESGVRTMTGNFVRDFPEEFQTAWTSSDENSGGLTRKSPSEQEMERSIQKGERAYINGLSNKEAFSSNPDAQRLEPSLDRTVSRIVESKIVEKENSETKVGPASQGEGDLSASVSAYVTPKQNRPAGINAQTSNVQSQKEKNALKEQDRALVREVRNIYEDTYGAIDSKHRQVPSAVQENTATSQQSTAMDQTSDMLEPTMYKILAYDPTMQSISSAETTSVVPDSSGPLAPAEVLLRLSNPAKFFPHFAPLRAQGYEIVSGSGDVLVFRKVREAAPMEIINETASATAANEDKSSLEHRKNVMNPIDGMSRGPIAATGDFASPTGFVNHDIPRGSEPPFKSNIDVRREESVFSGKRNWEDGGKRKKRGLVKTALIGAGWLAACSYAIGVVSEYFKTGGVDGLGPKGF